MMCLGGGGGGSAPPAAPAVMAPSVIANKETETVTKDQITKRKSRGKKGLTIDKDNASVGTGLNI